MKRILSLTALVLLSSGALAKVFTTTLEAINWGSPALELVERVDISKVDFKTNAISVKVWSCLETNQTVTRREIMMTHAVYPSCGCEECTGQLCDETTRVQLVERVEVLGRVIELSRKTISLTNRVFNPLQSTNRIYR